MKNAINLCLCTTLGSGLAALILRRKHKVVLRSKSQSEGYDIYLENIKKLSETDQNKLKCKLKTRREHIRNLKDPRQNFDVLIIGGGFSGAGVLFDAATRGLHCALIDKDDFATGISSKTIKLLASKKEYCNFPFYSVDNNFIKLRLLGSIMSELDFLLNSAPYLNKRIDIVIPCSSLFKLGFHCVKEFVRHFAGFVVWSFSDFPLHLPMPSVYSTIRMKALFPYLKGSNYGVRFSEIQTNDSRLILQTLLTSTIDNYVPGMKGAVLGNYIEFVDFVKDKDGICVGAKLRDKLENSEFIVKSRAMVNCAGASSDLIRIKDDPKADPQMLVVKSTNIALPYKYCESGMGLLIPREKIYLHPYTSMNCSVAGSHVESDSKGLLAVLENYLEIDKSKLKTSAPVWNTQSIYCIPRPAKEITIGNAWRMIKRGSYRLVDWMLRKPSKSYNTRNHIIEISRSGLITLVGGNINTLRKKGEDVVDIIFKKHPEINIIESQSTSKDIRLIGSYTSKSFGFPEETINEFIEHYEKFLHANYGLEIDTCRSLVQNYGANSIKVAELGKEFSTDQKLHKDFHWIKAQVLYGIRYEFALSVTDALRRLGMDFISKKQADEVIPMVAEIMAKELDWSKKKKEQEIADAQKGIPFLL